MRRLFSSFPSRRSSWIVVGVWLVLAAVFAPFGAKVVDITNDEYVLPGGSQTAQVQAILRDRFPGGDQRPAVIVYRRAGGLTEADRQTIAGDAAEVSRLAHVGDLVAPFRPGSPPGLVSERGDVAVMIAPIVAGKILHVTPTIEAIREVVVPSAGLETHVTGFTGIVSDYNSAIEEADVKLLGATVVLVLLLLIAVYRSPLLALVPLVVVGIAFSVANGMVYVLNRATDLPVDSSSTSLLLVLMFGAGTDYCLLLVSRYGVKLRQRESAEQALREALPEVAVPMIASGLTVIAALLTMLAAIVGIYRTLGPINAMGIAVVLLAGLTLLPALLRLLGRRVYWPNERSVEPSADPVEDAGGARWRAFALRVRRHPARFLAASVALLLACASTLVIWQTQVNPLAQFRTQTDSKRGYEILRSAFPAGAVNPTSVVVERTNGRVGTDDLNAVSARIASVAGVESVADTGRRSSDGRAALLSLVYTDDPFSAGALDRTQRVRDAVAAAGADTRVLVGGGSAERLDLRNGARRDLKVVVPLALGVVLLTLIVLLRALVAPLYLLATVVLSFAATLGLTTAILAFGFGLDDFNVVLPLIIFVFLVALGSDYNIFLMSRVREEAARRGTREGMLVGLASTGPVITSAGLILAGTFAVLTIIPSWDLTMIGLAVALGVLLDTFVVRSVCVPAITWLVGERSWWPSALARGAPSPSPEHEGAEWRPRRRRPSRRSDGLAGASAHAGQAAQDAQAGREERLPPFVGDPGRPPCRQDPLHGDRLRLGVLLDAVSAMAAAEARVLDAAHRARRSTTRPRRRPR